MMNILVPTDFSPTAWNATKYALTLFEDIDCIFYFLNVYTPEISSSRYMADKEQIPHHTTSAIGSEKALQTLSQKISIKFDNPRHSFKTISSFSLLIDEVKEAVIDFDIDFIVMGSNGFSASEKVFMGSNTVRIVKGLNICPVLVIPTTAEFIVPKNMTFVINTNRFYAKIEIEQLIKLVTIFNTAISIVGVHNDLEELTELQQLIHKGLEKSLEAIPHTFHRIIETGTISKSLKNFVAQYKVQILVLSNCSNCFMNGLCSEFVIERSVFYADIPVFVLPNKDKSKIKVKSNTFFSTFSMPN